MDETALREEARRVLQELGPLEMEELSSQLEARDMEVPEEDDLYRLLLEEVPGQFAAFPLTDFRLADLHHMLDGLQLTHVVTEEERTGGHLVVDPDLTPLILVSPDGRHVPLTGAGPDGHLDDNGRLVSPDGWLPSAPAVVACIHDGAVAVHGIEEVPGIDDNVVQRLWRGFLAANDRFGADTPLMVIEALARAPQLLHAPQAPLGDLLDAAGITAMGGRLVAEDDPAVDTTSIDFAEHLETDHGLSRQTADAVAVLHATVGELLDHILDHADPPHDEGPPLPDEDDVVDLTVDLSLDLDVDVDDLAEVWTEVLDDEQACLALIDDVVGSGPLAAVGVMTLLEHATPRLRGRVAKANRHWLQARLLEFVDDDDVEAERELRRARDNDDGHPGVNFDLARYVADRGQAGAALGLLRQVDGPGVAEWSRVLTKFVQPGPADAARNDPCPCGSGRKYKVCCAEANGWPLVERIEWIWDKVVRFSASPAVAWVVTAIAWAADAEAAGAAAMEDVAVANLALFEGGLLAKLCDRRGPLLPADELDLLRRWSTARARAYEAVEVTPGRGLELLNLTSGDRVALTDRSLSRSLRVGEAVLAWIVQDPDGPSSAGGVVKVPDHQRQPLLSLLDHEPDAEQLATWYASLHAPPTLRNAEGHPLELTTLTYEVDDSETARAALATHLEFDDTGRGIAKDDTDQWIRGSATIEDTTLTVSTNSATRAAWFAELVAREIPDAVLVDHERIPASELARRPGLLDDLDGSDDDRGLDDGLAGMSDDERAELEDQLDAMMTDYEDSWIDTSLPALGDVTPREAANDPTRRDDLRRLLDEFARDAEHWSSPGRPMDAQRLARLLGL